MRSLEQRGRAAPSDNWLMTQCVNSSGLYYTWLYG